MTSYPAERSRNDKNILSFLFSAVPLIFAAALAIAAPAAAQTDARVTTIETQTQEAQPRDEGDGRNASANKGDLVESPAGLPAAAAADEAQAGEDTNAPAFLEDPAGAISHLLTATDRNAGLPHDLSPWGMFMAADWVVKSVMIGLMLASLAVWTVWLAKSIEIACARGRARRSVDAIGSAANLRAAVQALTGRGGPSALMVRSAEDELRRSAAALDFAGNDGVKERLGARLARIEAQAARRLSRGTGLLATVGSVAPFIGLFGTVWGIMNSFIGISQAQTTNLAVVAPGIAEALLATAIGLVAAIPAVIVYNLFARSIAGYAQLLADAASGVEQLVSLQLDMRKIPDNDAGDAMSYPAVAAE